MKFRSDINWQDRAQKLLAVRPNQRIRIEKTRKMKKMGTFHQVMNQNPKCYIFLTVLLGRIGSFVRLRKKKNGFFAII